MRILKVVGLLLALGAVAGAVTGLLLSIGLSVVSPGGIRLEDRLEIYGIAAGFGAIVGSVSGPLIAMIFLRRVPLWRATVETAGAAGVGAAIAMSMNINPPGWAYAALLFALLAAFRLHWSYRKRAPAAADV